MKKFKGVVVTKYYYEVELEAADYDEAKSCLLTREYSEVPIVYAETDIYDLEEKI